MRSRELTIGRSFAVVLDHGEEFFSSLEQFCRTHHIHQGYIPTFIAGFHTTKIVGTCQRLDDPHAPVWDHVHLTNVEAHGSGTLAHTPDGAFAPHIHVSVGLKEHAATAHTSHLLEAHIQFLTELIIVEITQPTIHRVPQPDLYHVPLLQFPDPAP